MNRKKFIRNSLLATAGMAAANKISAGNKKASTYDKLMDQVGFNHIPGKEIKTMKSVFHKANTRGHANHGWLNSYHSFSFANYYNPERMNFGVLRVLNDDIVAPSKGFNTHPHDNMEIISIPLSGGLEHKDSMGNISVIKEGDVQVMSAGTGIYHSEFNKYDDQEVRFLQIWLFPNKKDVKPRYDQISLDQFKEDNKMHQILSPNPDDDGVWIHQNAWFHLGQLKEGHKVSHKLNDPSNGVYVFLLEGKIKIGDQLIEKRDGYGMWDIRDFSINPLANSKVLLMEVPMTV